MRQWTTVAQLAVVCVLLLCASCASDSSSASGGTGSAESYATFRPRELQALQTLERYRRPQPGSSYVTLDPDSGQIKKVWINGYYPPLAGPGRVEHQAEELRAGAVEIFEALAELKALESLSIPNLPPDFQEHINKLESLTELNLTSTLDDSLAASLATHPTLNSLGIYTPLLDPSHLEQLATLSRLQHITLGETILKPSSKASNLSEVDYLAQCSQLKSVKLAVRRVTPEELNKLAPLKLRKLSLQSPRLSNRNPHGVRELLAAIPAMTELEELELDEISPSGSMGGDEALLTGFEALQKLTRLTLHDLHLTRADLRTIGKLTSLEYLSIRIPVYLPGEAIADLKTLTNLRELHYDSEIAPAALAQLSLPEVTTISLRMPDREPETYAPLKQWPKLRKATFLKLKPNDTVIDALAACRELPGLTGLVHAASEGKLPELKRLEGLLELQPAELQQLGTHPSLQAMTLGMSEAGMTADVKPAAIKSLQSLPWLRDLKVRSAKLGKQHLAELRQLPDLDRLDLSGNSLTNEHVPDLAALANVKLIDLRGTQLTLKGLTELHELRPEMIVLAP